MGFKRYVVYSCLLLIIAYFYIYFTIDSSSKEITLYGLSFIGIKDTYSLKTVTWVMLPAIVLFFFSMLHFSFFAMKTFSKHLYFKEDTKKFMMLFNDKLLQKELPARVRFETKLFRIFFKLLKSVDYMSLNKKEFDVKNNIINETMHIIRSVENGDIIDPKILKKLKLEKTSYIILANEKNKLLLDSQYSKEILKTYKENTELDIYQQALEIFIKTFNLKDIQKLNLGFDKKTIFILLNRFASNDKTINLDQTSIINLIHNTNLKPKDFVEAAKMVKSKLEPEEVLSLFERLSTDDDMAMEAYIYILLEFEILDRADEVLSYRDDLEKYKLLLYLKSNKKHFDMSLFV